MAIKTIVFNVKLLLIGDINTKCKPHYKKIGRYLENDTYVYVI